jgi:hypothetical protein
MKERKVYVVNRSSHNYDEAKNFGKLIFMSEGRMNRFATNDMIRKFTESMENSDPEDYILLCSLNVMNTLAGSIFAHKHGTLNLLLFKEGKYLERNHKFV